MTMPLTKALAVIAETFTHPPLTDAKITGYMAVLSDLTPAEVDRGFRVVMVERGRKYFPTPGEFLEAARPSDTSASLALLFDRIEAAVLFNRYTLSRIAETFGVAAMEAVVAVGGLESVRAFADEKARAWRVKEFAAHYREVLAAEPAKRLPAPVQGRLAAPIAGLVEGLGRAMSLPKGDR